MATINQIQTEEQRDEEKSNEVRRGVKAQNPIKTEEQQDEEEIFGCKDKARNGRTTRRGEKQLIYIDDS